MTKTNPYSDDYEQASEHLRIALSLLAKHRIPPSPLNFRMGYDATSGKNESLRADLAGLAGHPDGYSSENLWALYRCFFVQDDKALETMRHELQRLITDIQGKFKESAGELSNYVATLDQFSGILSEPTSPERLSKEVRKVMQNTRITEQSQQQLESQLVQVVSEMKSLREELEQVREESLTDALTNIPNRKAFDNGLASAIREAEEPPSPLCVLLADIDHFKQFNDTYGHLVGDKVIRFVATTLKRCVKGGDMAARYGGEEFTVILPNTKMEGAVAVAEQIREAISSGNLTDKRTKASYGKITISIGVAQFSAPDLPEEILNRADQALYMAKEQGRNRVEKAELVPPATENLNGSASMEDSRQ